MEREGWAKVNIVGEPQDGDYYHVDRLKTVAYIWGAAAFALGLLAGWWFL